MSKNAKKKQVLIAGVIAAVTQIKVTQKDIDDSEQGHGNYCAIARAVHRTLGTNPDDTDLGIYGGGKHEFNIRVPVTLPVPQICVGGTLVPMTSDMDAEYNVPDYVDLPVTLTLPKAANEFIRRFDDDRDSVKPTTFAVTLRASK